MMAHPVGACRCMHSICY